MGTLKAVRGIEEISGFGQISTVDPPFCSEQLEALEIKPEEDIGLLSRL